MGSYSRFYFDNIEVDWEKNAALSVCRILFNRTDFLQVRFGSCRPTYVRSIREDTILAPTHRLTVFSTAQ